MTVQDDRQTEEQETSAVAERRFRRYTTQARQVMTHARTEAQQRNHDYLGGEHLLLALAHDLRSNAAQILGGLGVDLGEVIATINFLVHSGDHPAVVDPPYTSRLTSAIDFAEEEAQQSSHAAIGTDELLLGLVREGTNVAAKVLDKFGITLPAVREQVGRLASADREHDADTGRIKGNVLTCRIDNRDLAVIDALVEAGIRPTRSAAAAWLIHAGIETNHALIERVHAALTEIRRLRDEVQGTDPTE